MLTLKKVAVTGGLGSGKTTFCLLLQELGAFVISADTLVHQLLSPQTAVCQKVIQLLGPSILVGDRIDRQVMADLVFQDQQLLLQLENILHPAVLEEIKASYQRVKQQSFSLFIAEVPLLYEAHFETAFDAVICLTADEKLAKKRYIDTKQVSEQEFTRRTRRLLPIEEKCIRADFVITNDGSLDQLKQAATSVYQKLTS